MSEQAIATRHVIRGTIRRRLLVNALVDPDEAARHLPAVLRPHVVDGGTVVGCCLLDIDEIRPGSLPEMFGTRLRAAAHRISVEWNDASGAETVGVYVPMRHTDSTAATLLGGRWFPGVHSRADVHIETTGHQLTWTIQPAEKPTAFGIRVTASISSQPLSPPCGPVGDTCLNAVVGISPDHDGMLEAARMEPDHRHAQLVEIDDLESGFLAGFTTATPAPSYLMREVGVTWTPQRAPRIPRVEALP